MPRSKKPAASRRPEPPKVKTRIRQDLYIGKKDQAQKAGLTAHIGTSWEPLMGSIPPALSPEDDKFVRDHLLTYYRAHPKHPFHPTKRKALLAKIKAWDENPPQSDDPEAEEPTNTVVDQLIRAIDAYNEKQRHDA